MTLLSYVAIVLSRWCVESDALIVAVTHRAEGDVVVLQAAILGADERRQQALVGIQLVQQPDVVLCLLCIRRVAACLRSAVI